MKIIKKYIHHGRSKTPEYFSWINAKARCHKKTHPRYKDWGGRGIEVCEKWRYDFSAFFKDMGEKPSGNYSLDRIDNAKGYEPGNCRWATPKQQSTNRPSWTNIITFNGVSKTMTDWAEYVGIGRKTLYDRFENGWSIKDALTTPRLKSRWI